MCTPSLFEDSVSSGDDEDDDEDPEDAGERDSVFSFSCLPFTHNCMKSNALLKDVVYNAL